MKSFFRSELDKAIEELCMKAERDGCQIYVADDPIIAKIHFVLEKDSIFIRESIDYIDILDSFVPFKTKLSHYYSDWFESIQNKINRLREEN